MLLPQAQTRIWNLIYVARVSGSNPNTCTIMCHLPDTSYRQLDENWHWDRALHCEMHVSHSHPATCPPISSCLFFLPLLYRYTAVVMPVHYQHGTGQSSCRRVALMITAVWVLAFAVSCPLLFGLNTTGTEDNFTSSTHEILSAAEWLWGMPTFDLSDLSKEYFATR